MIPCCKDEAQNLCPSNAEVSLKNDESVFLAVVRVSNDFVPLGREIRGKKKWDKNPPSYVAVNFAYGMTEGQKRKINKESGPKKDIITVKGREREVLDNVPEIHRKPLQKLIQEYQDMFPEKLPKEHPPIGRRNIVLKSSRVVNSHIDLLIDWVLLSRMI